MKVTPFFALARGLSHGVLCCKTKHTPYPLQVKECHSHSSLGHMGTTPAYQTSLARTCTSQSVRKKRCVLRRRSRGKATGDGDGGIPGLTPASLCSSCPDITSPPSLFYCNHTGILAVPPPPTMLPDQGICSCSSCRHSYSSFLNLFLCAPKHHLSEPFIDHSKTATHPYPALSPTFPAFSS